MGILAAANALIYSTAFYSQVAFGFNSRHDFVLGPLGFTCHIVSILLLVKLAYLTVVYYRTNNSRFLVFPFLVVVTIVAGALGDKAFYITGGTFSVKPDAGWVASNCVIKENSDGTYTVKKREEYAFSCEESVPAEAVTSVKVDGVEDDDWLLPEGEPVVIESTAELELWAGKKKLSNVAKDTYSATTSGGKYIYSFTMINSPITARHTHSTVVLIEPEEESDVFEIGCENEFGTALRIFEVLIPTDTNYQGRVDSIVYNGEAYEAKLNQPHTSSSYPSNFTCDVTTGNCTIEYYDGSTKLNSAPVNAGTYTAKVKIDYTLDGVKDSRTIQKNFTIASKQITAEGMEVTVSKDSKAYDGKAPTLGTDFDVTVKDGDKTLVVGEDYIVTVTPANKTAAGTTFQIRVSGIKNYAGNKDFAFAIEAANAADGITLNANDKVYDAAEYRATEITAVEGTIASEMLANSTVTYEYYDPKNVYDAAKTLNSQAWLTYGLTYRASDVNRSKISFTDNNANSYYYTDPERTVKGTRELSEIKINYDGTIDAKYTDGTPVTLYCPVGYTYKVEAVGSYSGGTVVLKLVERNVGDYNIKKATPLASVPVDAGEYVVRATIHDTTGNFADVVKYDNFEITPKPVSISLTNTNMTYTVQPLETFENNISSSVTSQLYTRDGLNKDDLAMLVDSEGNTVTDLYPAVGEYTYVLSNDANHCKNYAFSFVTDKVTVSPFSFREIGSGILVFDSNYTNIPYRYNGSAQSPAITIINTHLPTPDATVNTELVKDVDYTVTYEKFDGTNYVAIEGTPIEAGSYRLVSTGIGNYKDTRVLPFEIAPFDISNEKGAKVLDLPTSAAYTGYAIVPSFAVAADLDYETELEVSFETIITKDKDYTVEYYKGGEKVDEIKEVGEYKIRISGIGNYKKYIELPFEVTAAALTAEDFVITPKEIIYDGKPVDSTDFEITAKDGAKKELAQAFLAANPAFKVIPDMSVIAQESRQVNANTNIEDFGIHFGQQLISNVSYSISDETKAKPMSINLLNGDSFERVITHVEVAYNDHSMLIDYLDGSEPKIEIIHYTADNVIVVNKDSEGKVSLNETLPDDPILAPTRAGSYSNKITLASDNINFPVVTFENVAFTINKRPVTLTADDKESTYLATPPKLTATVEGDIENSGLDWSRLLEYETVVDPITPVGTIDIVMHPDWQTSALYNDFDDNYTVTFHDGTYTVKPYDLAAGLADKKVTISIEPTTFSGTPITFDLSKVTITAPYFYSDEDQTYTLAPNTDFVFSAGKKKALNANTYTQTFEGQGNFTGEIDGEWVVGAKGMRIDYNFGNEGTKTYDGKPISVDGMFTALEDDQAAAAVEDVTYTYRFVKESDYIAAADEIVAAYGAEEPEQKLFERLFKKFESSEYGTAPKNVGNYFIFVKAEAKNYNTAYQSHVYKITKATGVTVVPEKTVYDVEYGSASEVAVTFNITGLVEGDAIDPIVVKADIRGKKVADAATVVTPQYTAEQEAILGNYDFTTTVAQVKIVRQSLKKATVTVNKKYLPAGGKVSFAKEDITVTDKYGNTVDPEEYIYDPEILNKPGTYEVLIEAAGNGNYMDFAAGEGEIVEAPSFEIVTHQSAVEDNQIKFVVHYSDMTIPDATYGVLAYRKSSPLTDPLTLNTAGIENAKFTYSINIFRAKDNGYGVTVRPYIKVGNEVIYGKQLTINYNDLIAAEAVSEPYSSITVDQKFDDNGQIQFVSHFVYKGTQDAKYGVLAYRKDTAIAEPITKDTVGVENAKFDYSDVIFRAKDNGNGVILRPYIIVDGEYLYGKQIKVFHKDY